MNTRRPILAANWKMNKAAAETPTFLKELSTQLAAIPSHAQVIVFPPATHLGFLKGAGASAQTLELGAQNCGTAKSGAYTGEISPATLRELGANWVLLGHSERRHLFGESDGLILSRAAAALKEGLQVLLCIGENLQERKSEKTFRVLETQLAILKNPAFPSDALPKVALAYEPVWAIGTGENASPAQAQEVHQYVRRWVGKELGGELAEKMRILYGGSAKPENAESLMGQADVDGLLVGGASLELTTFVPLVRNGLRGKDGV